MHYIPQTQPKLGWELALYIDVVIQWWTMSHIVLLEIITLKRRLQKPHTRSHNNASYLPQQ